MSVSADATGAIAVLEQLASRLQAHGWQVRLHAPPDRRPMLYVSNPGVRALSELVTAGQDSDGSWWLWWSWAERISPAGELDRAVTVIGRVLASGGAQLDAGAPAATRT